MGSEVGLALQLCAMRTIGGFVKDAATESGGRAARLVESIKILEEEKRKIEAFQRELPLCMHLLGEGPLDASFSLSFHWIRFLAVLRIPVAVIDGLKKETERCGGGCFGRVLQELLPVESRVEEDGEVKVDDKMNWMSSAQLWSDNYGENDISHEHHEVMICGKKEELFVRFFCLHGSSASGRDRTDAGKGRRTCSWNARAPAATALSYRLKRC